MVFICHWGHRARSGCLVLMNERGHLSLSCYSPASLDAEHERQTTFVWKTHVAKDLTPSLIRLCSATMHFVIFASPPNHSGFLSNNRDVAEVHTVSFNSQDVTEVLFTAVVAIFIHSTPFSFLNVIHLLMSLMTHLLDIVVRQSPVVG